MEEKSIKIILMSLMKSMGYRDRLTAEVVSFLMKEDQQKAMLVYLMNNRDATEDDIYRTVSTIIKN